MTGPIFDTHAHYSARAFDADRFALLDSLPDKGVVGVCEQATHSGDAPRVLELAHRYPWVVAAIGIHPESLLPAAVFSAWPIWMLSKDVMGISFMGVSFPRMPLHRIIDHCTPPAPPAQQKIPPGVRPRRDGRVRGYSNSVSFDFY